MKQNIAKKIADWNAVKRRAIQKVIDKKRSLTEGERQEMYDKANRAKAKTAGKMKENRAVKKTVTDPYFDYHIANAKGVCENCVRQIPYWQFGLTQAHILPKRDNQFPSVAGVIENHLELCPDCHTLYDRSFDDAAQMPVFSLAVERFKLFERKIALNEKGRIPECFLF